MLLEGIQSLMSSLNSHLVMIIVTKTFHLECIYFPSFFFEKKNSYHIDKFLETQFSSFRYQCTYIQFYI